MVIDKFVGEWEWLSNFSPHPLVLHDGVYRTLEHAYQASKTLSMLERDLVRNTETPGKAKRFGRFVELRPDWESFKYQAMDDLLYEKFVTQHPYLGIKLFETGRVILVEGNTWHDNVWGDCRCDRVACSEPGTNALGQLLMQLRRRLK